MSYCRNQMFENIRYEYDVRDILDENNRFVWSERKHFLRSMQTKRKGWPYD